MLLSFSDTDDLRDLGMPGPKHYPEAVQAAPDRRDGSSLLVYHRGDPRPGGEPQVHTQGAEGGEVAASWSVGLRHILPVHGYYGAAEPDRSHLAVGYVQSGA